MEIPRYSAVPTPGSMLKYMGKYLRRAEGPMLGGVVTYAQPGTALYHVSVIGERYMYHAAMENKKVVKVTLSPACFRNRRICFTFDRPEQRAPRIGSPLTLEGTA
jgi:hypothetical protein